MHYIWSKMDKKGKVLFLALNVLILALPLFTLTLIHFIGNELPTDEQIIPVSLGILSILPIHYLFSKIILKDTEGIIWMYLFFINMVVIGYFYRPAYNVVSMLGLYAPSMFAPFFYYSLLYLAKKKVKDESDKATS